MTHGTICTRCQNHIVGHINKYNNNLYCDHCYEEIMMELQRIEEEKSDLYTFIKNLFGIPELPYYTLTAIEKAIKEGKKISGIEGTLMYYYNILGNTPDDINLVGVIIQKAYSEAASYYNKVRQVRESNKNVDINVPPVVIRLDPNKHGGRKLKYNMEDL